MIWAGESTGTVVFQSSLGGVFELGPVPEPLPVVRKPPLPVSQSRIEDAGAVYDVAGRRVREPLPSGIYWRRIAGVVRRFVVLR